MKHRLDQSSILLANQNTPSPGLDYVNMRTKRDIIDGETVPSWRDSSSRALQVRMGKYFEVLEMSELIREIHDAGAQSCSSLLVKKPNALV